MNINKLIDDEVYALYKDDKDIQEDIIHDNYKYKSGSLYEDSFNPNDYFLDFMSQESHEFCLKRELDISKSINDGFEVDLYNLNNTDYESINLDVIHLDGDTLKINTNEIKFNSSTIYTYSIIYSYKYKISLVFDIIYVISLFSMIEKLDYDDFSKEVTINITKNKEEETLKIIDSGTNVYTDNGIYYCCHNSKISKSILVPYKFLYRIILNTDFNYIKLNQHTVPLFFCFFSNESLDIISISQTNKKYNYITKDKLEKIYGKNKLTIFPNPCISLECLRFIMNNFFNLDYDSLASLFPPENKDDFWSFESTDNAINGSKLLFNSMFDNKNLYSINAYGLNNL